MSTPTGRTPTGKTAPKDARNLALYRDYMEMGPDGKKKYTTAQLTAKYNISTTAIFLLIKYVKKKFGADIHLTPPKEIDYDRIDGEQ